MNRAGVAPTRDTATGGRAGRGEGTWGGARRIARAEADRAWPSYLVSALLALPIGLLCLNFLWLSLRNYGGNVEDVPVSFITDVVLLSTLANLSVNWTSLRWWYVHRDPFTGRLSFLRTLPIPVRVLILGRLAVMLLATPVASVAFFLPAYALFPALRAEIPPLQYLWFALFWVGYVLLTGGLFLWLEIGVRGKVALVVSLVWGALLVSAVVLAQALGTPLAEGSVGLVRAHGPLAAVLALAVGGGGLSLWCWLLERRLKTREFPS